MMVNQKEESKKDLIRCRMPEKEFEKFKEYGRLMGLDISKLSRIGVLYVFAILKEIEVEAFEVWNKKDFQWMIKNYTMYPMSCSFDNFRVMLKKLPEDLRKDIDLRIKEVSKKYERGGIGL